jgi:hypothetical protein
MKNTKFLSQILGMFIPKADSGPYSHSMSMIEDNRFQATRAILRADSGPYSHSMSNIEDNRLQSILFDSDVPTPASITPSHSTCKVNSIISFTLPTWSAPAGCVAGYYFGFGSIQDVTWADPTTPNVIEVKVPAAACTLYVTGNYCYKDADGVVHIGAPRESSISVQSTGTVYGGTSPGSLDGVSITGDLSVSGVSPKKVYSIPSYPTKTTKIKWSWVCHSGTDPVNILVNLGLSCLVYFKNGKSVTGHIEAMPKNVYGTNAPALTAEITVST